MFLLLSFQRLCICSMHRLPLFLVDCYAVCSVALVLFGSLLVKIMAVALMLAQSACLSPVLCTSTTTQWPASAHAHPACLACTQVQCVRSHFFVLPFYSWSTIHCLRRWISVSLRQATLKDQRQQRSMHSIVQQPVSLPASLEACTSILYPRAMMLALLLSTLATCQREPLKGHLHGQHQCLPTMLH